MLDIFLLIIRRILNAIKIINKIVPGIMSDPKRLEEIEKRITENTQEKFKEYAEMHRRAYAESYRRVLD